MNREGDFFHHIYDLQYFFIYTYNTNSWESLLMSLTIMLPDLIIFYILTEIYVYWFLHISELSLLWNHGDALALESDFFIRALLLME